MVDIPRSVTSAIAQNNQPQQPKLEVSYQDAPPSVYINHTLSATCTALVGTEGVLTIGLMRSSSSHIWTADRYRVLSGRSEQDLFLSHSPAKMDCFMGPKVAVQLLIRIGPEDDGATIHCFPSDTSRNFGQAVSAQKGTVLRESSLSFVVKGESKPPL
ncbi:hypothetical protein ElyMa_005742900 [Elysia marginata]|uniref:Uncharacterized protein n=1 Tax=Elysia marginata TaxID=1093978 RepID=A0AAV4FMM2_9GAST|nr:hypothetical protein ElyMa_005742900 [Elysia marginata]